MVKSKHYLNMATFLISLNICFPSTSPELQTPSSKVFGAQKPTPNTSPEGVLEQ